MVSESAVPDGDHVGNAVNSIKKQGKVPKKIHKAEREKQKRDHMNILFVELRNVVEPTQPSSGKACVMNDTIRMLKELLAQVDCFKKENVALLSESHDVSNEKNELCEETSALQSQVEKLQSEIMERTHSHSSMNFNLLQSQSNISASKLPEDHLRLPTIDNQPQPTSVVHPPFLIVPLHHDSQVYTQCTTAEAFPCNAFTSNVKKPRPRYPSPSDSWPSHILEGQVNGIENTRQSSGSVISSTSSSGDLGLNSN
ncbi:hypothetical protein ACH5RR_011166 [Cinchona calisaya]|uniref:BHLH domain-containing protein n=1 Tax=Cinchona calisaya TaxID=153742 RepID=A0ABD3A7J6_9GENT